MDGARDIFVDKDRTVAAKNFEAQACQWNGHGQKCSLNFNARGEASAYPFRHLCPIQTATINRPRPAS